MRRQLVARRGHALRGLDVGLGEGDCVERLEGHAQLQGAPGTTLSARPRRRHPNRFSVHSSGSQTDARSKDRHSSGTPPSSVRISSTVFIRRRSMSTIIL